MGKRGRKRERERVGTMGPAVNVKVIYASMDMRALGALLKPAILYGDTVTVYSPAAFLLGKVDDLSRVTSPADQFALVLELSREVPTALPNFAVDDAQANRFRAFLSLDRRAVRRLGRAHGMSEDTDDLYRLLDGMEKTWSEDLGAALAKLTESLGAQDVLTAVRHGAAEVAPLAVGTNPIAESLRAATREDPEDAADPILMDFLDRVTEVVSDDRGFPLIDHDAKDLVRVMPFARSQERSAQVSAASSFMGYLPYFPTMPMDEVIDLRTRIRDPLKRFRGAMGGLRAEFSAHPVDDRFEVEVERAWRYHVAPALTDIREAMTEQGLLRHARGIALESLPRVSTQTLGVLAVGVTDLLSMSRLMTGAAALALPIGDIALRALKASLEGKASTRHHGFYLLDLIDQAARQTA